MNAYYNPEEYLLETIGEIEWDEDPYQFDLTVVWRRKVDGKLVYASDSGCSCPSPFEDHRLEDGDFTVATFHQISDYLMSRVTKEEEYWERRNDRLRGRVAQLIGRLAVL